MGGEPMHCASFLPLSFRNTVLPSFPPSLTLPHEGGGDALHGRHMAVEFGGIHQRLATLEAAHRVGPEVLRRVLVGMLDQAPQLLTQK